MSHLRVRYHAVLTVVLGALVLLDVAQAQPQQNANSTPTLNVQDSPANARTSQSGDPLTSSNKQTFDTPNSDETTRQDVGVLQGIADVTAKTAEEQTMARGTGNALSLWDYVSAKTLSEEDRAGFALGTSLSQQLFLADDPAFGWAGLFVAVADRAGLLQQTQIEKMEDNAYLNGFVTPQPVLPTLNGSGGMMIDSRLASDSPAPLNGISIETRSVPNPSNDGIEVQAPSVPISIQTSLLPDYPSVAPPLSQSGYSAGAGGPHFDWAGFLDAAAPLVEAGVRAYSASHPTTISAPPAPARANAPTQVTAPVQSTATVRGVKGTGSQNAAPSTSTQSNSNSICGPGYYVNPNFLAGSPYIPGQSVCVANGTTQ